MKIGAGVGVELGILVQASTGTSPDRRATTTRVPLFVAGLFIDSQSVVPVSDGAHSDLAMVEARRLFQRACSSVGVWWRPMA
jgi:hypothetical protein